MGHTNQQKNRGITSIELLFFMFMLIAGCFMSAYLGKRFGCIGVVLGFPVGVIVVIATLFIVAFVSDTIGSINFNRKKKLEQFSKNLKIPKLDLQCKHIKDSSVDYILSHADLHLDNTESIDLSFTNITDRSLDQFKYCNELKSIRLV